MHGVPPLSEKRPAGHAGVGAGVGTGVGTPVTDFCVGSPCDTMMSAVSATTLTLARSGNSPDALAVVSASTNVALKAAGVMAATLLFMAVAAASSATEIEVSKSTAFAASPRPCISPRRRRVAARMLLIITLPTVVLALAAMVLRYTNCGPVVKDSSVKPASLVEMTILTPPTAKVGDGVGAGATIVQGQILLAPHTRSAAAQVGGVYDGDGTNGSGRVTDV